MVDGPHGDGTNKIGEAPENRLMENIQSLTKKLAKNLKPCARQADTLELLLSCIDVAVELALALNCARVQNTGSPGC